MSIKTRKINIASLLVLGSMFFLVLTGPTSLMANEAKINPVDGAANDYFGRSVGVCGQYVIVSSNGNGSGSAYIFKRSGGTWTQQTHLMPSDRAAQDYFGGSVSIYKNYVIVGARGDDDNGSSSGSAYVFDEIYLPGDIDDSGDLDLTDAILALKVLAGIVPASEVYKETDVNNDGKIGLEEVIFILQDAAGLRLNPPEED